MGFSGRIGAAAASGLEELLTRQLLEAQNAESMRAKRVSEDMQGQQLQLQRDRFLADQERQSREDEQAGIDALRSGQDRMAARLSKVQGEQDQMDAAARLAEVLKGLTPRQQQVVQLGGKLSMDDLKTADDRKAEEDAAVSRAGRIANAQAAAAARYREPKGPKVPNATLTPSGNADTAAEVVRVAKALREHKGMKSAFGSVDSMVPTIRQDTADAEALRNSLMSMLTMENMGKMKGVLSDRDMEVLRQASTSLNPKMGDAAAAAELDRIIQSAGRAGATAPVPSHDGAAERRPIPGVPGGVAELRNGRWVRVQ